MKRFLPAVAALAFLLLTNLSAFAGVIVVSGDGNFANALDGSGGVPLDANNQQFFVNVLGGGTTVLVQSVVSTSPSLNVADTAVNNFYNGLGGVSSSIYSGLVDATALSGIDLYVSIVPNDAYTVAEIGALSSFVGSGGSLFLLGDNSSFSTENGYLNSLLAGLGSSMSIVDGAVSGAIPVADSLTVGVGNAQYVLGSTVSGGTLLFQSSFGDRLVAYENTPVVNIPEPGTLGLFGLGLAGLCLARRKRTV